VQVLTWRVSSDTWTSAHTVFQPHDRGCPGFVVTGDHLRLLYSSIAPIEPNSVVSIQFNNMTGKWSNTTESTTLGSIIIDTASFPVMSRAYGVYMDGSRMICLSVYADGTGWQALEHSGIEAGGNMTIAVYNGRLYCAARDKNDWAQFFFVTRAIIDINPTTWMTSLPSSFDDKPISQLTIPGAHDSTADRVYGVKLHWGIPFVATQSVSILDQLNSGVRCFDLRVRLNGTTLEMYHGPISLGLTFDSVCQTMYTWLAEHPREFLLASIKKENTDSSDEYAFAAAMDIYTTDYATHWLTTDTVLLIAVPRKHFQLIRRYKISNKWPGPLIPHIGIDLSYGWTDNSPYIVIGASHSTTFI